MQDAQDQQQNATPGDQSTWAVLIHLSGFAGVFFFGLQIVAPLVLWLVTRPNREMVNAHGKAALNFQISIFLYQIALVIILVITVIAVAAADAERLADLVDSSIPDDELLSEILSIFLQPVLIAVAVGIVGFFFSVIMMIRAAVRAGRGDTPGYFLAIRFLR